MSDKNGFFDLSKTTLSRRTALKGLAAGAGLAVAPVKIGFQSHRTGIGAAYGRWYEKTSAAAVKAINDAGGINGRQVELVIEDDGTDPARGAEVVGKFATQHKTDIVFGTLFSHVVIGSA
ncbi:MAG: ABC transporter substrate-binding protein, partial [Mesorhizobium sp.]